MEGIEKLPAPDSDILSAPKIVTLSGRQACLMSGGDKSQIKLDVLPQVGADGCSVRLTVIANLDFDPSGKIKKPAPESVVTANVWDGQTLAIWKRVAGTHKIIMTYVTPTLIDSVGNRINTNDDMPFVRNSIPPQ